MTNVAESDMASREDELAARVRAFFDIVPGVLAAVPPGLPRAKAWRAALYDHGFGGIDFPVEFGGQGDDPALAQAWARESVGRVPRDEAVFGIGVGMALPTIRDHGSDELRERFLRPGLRGEEIWCQLYSEPEAGSDLAALRTTAERDGDEWVVNGQKVWSSGAQHADLGILLARTDRDAPKHHGITMFAIPMRQPGVTVRPLRQMTGVAEFNEVFMDDARVPASWVVGEVNGGWAMAKALLAHERVATGTRSVDVSGGARTKTGRNPLPVSQLIDLARSCGRDGDMAIRQQLARLYSGELIMRALGRRRAHPSIGKLWRTMQGRAAAEVAASLGIGAAAWEPDDAESDYWAYHVLNCRAMSIGGGTDEIQRNTLGERALGLPREPDPERGR